MGRRAGQSVRLCQIALATFPAKEDVESLAHAAAFPILTDRVGNSLGAGSSSRNGRRLDHRNKGLTS